MRCRGGVNRNIQIKYDHRNRAHIRCMRQLCVCIRIKKSSDQDTKQGVTFGLIGRYTAKAIIEDKRLGASRKPLMRGHINICQYQAGAWLYTSIQGRFFRVERVKENHGRDSLIYFKPYAE